MKKWDLNSEDAVAVREAENLLLQKPLLTD